MALTFAFSGSATEYAAGNGDLSSAVASGSTYAIILFRNTNDFPIKVHWRQSGSSDDANVDLSPGEYTAPIYVGLTAARTVDYYIEGGGSVSCYVVTYGGTGLVLSSVTSSDVTAWIEMLGYTVGATGNLTAAQIQLCLDDVVSEVGLAASRYEAVAMYAVNTAFKNRTTLKGAVMQALYVLRNKGSSTGLTQDRLIMAVETAQKYEVEYEKAINDMKNGWNLGA